MSLAGKAHVQIGLGLCIPWLSSNGQRTVWAMLFCSGFWMHLSYASIFTYATRIWPTRYFSYALPSALRHTAAA